MNKCFLFSTFLTVGLCSFSNQAVAYSMKVSSSSQGSSMVVTSYISPRLAPSESFVGASMIATDQSEACRARPYIFQNEIVSSPIVTNLKSFGYKGFFPLKMAKCDSRLRSVYFGFLSGHSRLVPGRDVQRAYVQNSLEFQNSIFAPMLKSGSTLTADVKCSLVHDFGVYRLDCRIEQVSDQNGKIYKSQKSKFVFRLENHNRGTYNIHYRVLPQ